MKKIKTILGFLMLGFLVRCGLFQPETGTGSITVYISSPEKANELAKADAQLSYVKCMVEKGSKSIYDNYLTHEGGSFSGKIDDLEPGDDYSITLYGKNNNYETIVYGYQRNVNVTSGKNTSVSITWLGTNLTYHSGSGTYFDPTSVVRGGTFTNNFEVQNTGGKSSGEFKLYVYLSVDDHLETSKDFKVGESTKYYLGAGSDEKITTTCTVPSNLATGRYYVFKWIDAENDVIETDETDNVWYSSINLLTVQINWNSYYEPNDEMDDAYGPLTSGQQHYAYIENSIDEDWYWIYIDEDNTSLTVDLDVPSTKDYDLKVYDADENQVGSSALAEGQDENIQISLSTGTYYIKVYGYQDAYSNSSSYKLKAQY